MTAQFNEPQRYAPPTPVAEGDRVGWRDVVVAEVPGFRPLTLDLFRPVAVERPSPLIIWIHGGAWLFGSNKSDGPRLAPGDITTRILAAGFAVARVTYRFSREACFPAQLHDVKAAVRWLREYAGDLGLDPARFGVWGESAGGHLASLVALTGDDPDPALAGRNGILGVSDAVQSAVLWYAPGNLLSMAAQSHPEGVQDHDAPDAPESLLVGGPVQTLPNESAAASPVTYVSGDTPPILLMHGADDRVVPAAQSEELYDRLAALSAPVTLRIIPGADHCFTGADLAPLIGESLEHFAKTLS
ncbi:alpha/beta hydrolase [Actinoplanes oblitus]|uniref:Alpha/beta hydrolase n=1 Tax=Actinoplanes oblitus TaxID=3040509 RepID=A0ABY8WM44_9ACTN|nr:alpha/beta hydrolase [Actinoplanes oblitus]WIM98492.1 alpha/beta hydrolase [Actinoplanes oblitus]